MQPSSVAVSPFARCRRVIPLLFLLYIKDSSFQFTDEDEGVDEDEDKDEDKDRDKDDDEDKGECMH